MNEQMPKAVREGAERAEEAVTGNDAETNMREPERTDLGAAGNDALIDPLPEDQERQPRPDEVDPEEPLGAPEDPLQDDPSRVRGDRAENDM